MNNPTLRYLREEIHFSFQAILHQFYPKTCLSCNYEIPPFDEHICLSCEVKLPKTNFHQNPNNRFAQRFWGKVQIEAGTAMYYFKKGSRTQNLVHNLKYKNKPEIGLLLGNMLGRDLKNTNPYRMADVIVPVPLHWKKLRLRGYNQSAMFANGIAEEMGIPTVKHGLRRVENSASQTKKSRIERLQNVTRKFEVVDREKEKLIGKHILLVDDVLTSGATLESCAAALLKLPGTKVSLATIAIAME